MRKVLYFTRHDVDLWEAIKSLPEGEQNHLIRQALRSFFLNEETALPTKYIKQSTAPATEQASKDDQLQQEVERLKIEQNIKNNVISNGLML